TAERVARIRGPKASGPGQVASTRGPLLILGLTWRGRRWPDTVNGSRSSGRRRSPTVAGPPRGPSASVRSRSPPTPAAAIQTGTPRLRLAIDTAKEANMPNVNIDRAVKKGTGELEGETIVELAYEGYGPAGVAIYIEATSDNPTRTVADVRHAMSRNGGTLGA